MANQVDGRNEKILVVDDAPDILRLIETLLKLAGYQTLVAREGEEALRLARSEKPDLVLLDVMMPGISGIEVCGRLRAQPETADMPIILLSALTQPLDKVNGLRAGADDYMTKPPDRDELLARVALHLDRSRRLRAARAGSVKRGKVIGFMGAKGGVGTTTVASNIAALIAQQKKSVILLELRPTYGTLALQLKSAATANLSSLLDLAPDRIDGQALSARLFAATGGVRILFGPQNVVEFRELDADHTRAIVQAAAALADFVVVDLAPLPSAAHQAVAELVEVFCLVLESEPSCVSAAKVGVRVLHSWGLTGSRIAAVIANRAGFSTTVSLPDIRAQLGCEIAGVMPFAGEACIAATSQGVPLVLFRPENMAAGTLRDMAARLTTDTLVGIRA